MQIQFDPVSYAALEFHQVCLGAGEPSCAKLLPALSMPHGKLPLLVGACTCPAQMDFRAMVGAPPALSLLSPLCLEVVWESKIVVHSGNLIMLYCEQAYHHETACSRFDTVVLLARLPGAVARFLLVTLSDTTGGAESWLHPI